MLTALDYWLLGNVFQPIANLIRYPAFIGQRIAPGIVVFDLFAIAIKGDFGALSVALILCDLMIANRLWRAAASAESSPNPNVQRLHSTRVITILACVFIAVLFARSCTLPLFLRDASALIWFLSAYLLSCEVPPPRRQKACSRAFGVA